MLVGKRTEAPGKSTLSFMSMVVCTPYEYKGINYIAKAAREPNRKKQKQENKGKQGYPIRYPECGKAK